MEVFIEGMAAGAGVVILSMWALLHIFGPGEPTETLRRIYGPRF